MEFLFMETEVKGHKLLELDHDEFKVIFTKDSARGNYKKSEIEGLENIKSLREAFNMKELLFLNQVHSTIVLDNPSEVIDGDGIITDKFNVGIGAFGADCPPVVIIDLEEKIAGIVHSGWKGTFHEIVKKLIGKMVCKFKCESRNMIAFIGPHARSCCYEVSEDMINNFNEKELFKKRVSDGRMLDLSKCIRLSIEDAGIHLDRIFDVEECTICNKEFHSYRRDNEKSGRNIAVVVMKGLIS